MFRRVVAALIVITTSMLIAGCSSNGAPGSAKPIAFPTPRPATHPVHFAANTFQPAHAPKGALTALEAYQMISPRSHWPAGVVAQYGKLTGVRSSPIGVWAYEGTGTCNHYGPGGTPPPVHFCTGYDFVDARTGEAVLSIGP